MRWAATRAAAARAVSALVVAALVVAALVVAALVVPALVLSGCAGRGACVKVARQICEAGRIACPPLEQRLAKTPAKRCQGARSALARVQRLPPDLRAAASLSVAARLLGITDALRVMQAAHLKVQSLLVAASQNQPTDREEAALVALGTLACPVITESYATATPSGRDPLLRVLRALAARDLGSSAQAWRSWCRDEIDRQAPDLAALGLVPASEPGQAGR